MKKIFIDLDETLIASYYAGGVSETFKTDVYVDDLGRTKADIACGLELYRGTLRPYAREFIQKLQEKYGVENVFILTRSIRPYALSFCEVFKLGIDPDRVFARDLLPYQMEPQRGYEAVLFDNLPSRENEEKHVFLNRSEFDKVTYIEVLDFYGQKGDDYLKNLHEAA